MRGYIILLAFATFVLRTDSEITCDAPTVKKGSPANITCHFDTDIVQTRTPFCIDRYTDGNPRPQAVLRCHWPEENSTNPRCTHKEGYSYVLTDTRSLNLQISSTTEEYAGNYACLEIASDETVKHCKLTLKQTVNDSVVTCDAPVVVRGSPANITCHFGTDISRTRTPFGVDRYMAGQVRQVVLRCHWPEGNRTVPKCTHKKGFSYNLAATRDLTLQISSITEDNVGPYVCQELGSDDYLEQCEITLKQAATDNNTTVAIVVGVLLTTGLAFLLYTCRRRRTRHTKGAGRRTTNTTAQRLLRDTDEKIKKFEKDRLPFDHDTYDKALKLLEEEDVVMIMGPEKCGKTTIGRALQRYFKGKEYTPLDLNRHDSWNLFGHFTGKLILLLDEVFTIGDFMTDEASWSSVFRSMKDRCYPVIVIIKTDMDTQDVVNNLPPFVKDFPKVVVANDNLTSELYRVCKRGHLNDLKNLLRHHVDVNVTNIHGESPLHNACAFHHEDIVKVLLPVTQNIDARDSQGQTPLHHACDQHDASEAASELTTSTEEVDDDQSKSVSPTDDDEKEQRAPIATNTSDEIGNASTHVAQGDQHFTGRQDDVITDLLLKHGAEPEATDNRDRTPLHLACHKGNRAAVTALLNADVNIEAEDPNGLRPLHLACQNGDAETINSLLCRNCMVDTRDKQQRTPLHWACEYDKDVAVRLLLQHGANVEADVHGVRPLHVASKRGTEKIVQILLHHGANVNAKDPDGQKPSSIAKSYDNKKLIPLLKKAERKYKVGIFRL